MTTDTVYQCPQCGSPAVEYGELVGSSAICSVCGWQGDREQLVGTPFEHILGTREGIGFELVNDVRRLLSDQAVVRPIAGFLSRWGFVDFAQPRPVVVNLTTRYIAAIARGILAALIEERKKIEESENGTKPEQG